MYAHTGIFALIVVCYEYFYSFLITQAACTNLHLLFALIFSVNYSSHKLLILSCSTHLCMDVGFGIIYSIGLGKNQNEANKVVLNNGPKRSQNCVYLDSTDTV